MSRMGQERAGTPHSAYLQCDLFPVFSLPPCCGTPPVSVTCPSSSPVLVKYSLYFGENVQSPVAEAPSDCNVSGSGLCRPFFPQESWRLPHARTGARLNYSLGPREARGRSNFCAETPRCRLFTCHPDLSCGRAPRWWAPDDSRKD